MIAFEIPVAALLFLLLFVGSLIGYLRSRAPLAGVVTLIFGASVPIFVGRLLDRRLRPATCRTPARAAAPPLRHV
jgi:uncharacterized membrane protein (UPF0136 family)